MNAVARVNQSSGIRVDQKKALPHTQPTIGKAMSYSSLFGMRKAEGVFLIIIITGNGSSGMYSQIHIYNN